MGMNFNNTTAIYLQIVDFICRQILTGRWPMGERLLSVRELGIQLEVNPNTIMRSYEILQNQQIIENKRGVGYFVSQDAVQRIQVLKKEQFVREDLPQLFQNMELLGINLSQLDDYYQQWKNNQKM